MRTVIQRASLPPGQRILVVSDVHAHAKLLRALLAKANYGGGDILILLGDYVERGAENLESLRLVRELLSRDNVYALMGNVDAWRLNMLDMDAEALFAFYRLRTAQYGGTLVGELCLRIGVLPESPADIERAKPRLREVFEEECGFLRGLPTILDAAPFLFVHGGLPSADLEALRERDAFEMMKFDNFAGSGLRFDRYVFAGHWPTILYDRRLAQMNPVVYREARIVSVDGGCGVKRQGQLNALVIPDRDSEDFSWLYVDDLPEAVALDGQEGSAATLHLDYGDFLTVLCREGDFLAGRHEETGRLIELPAADVYEANGKDAIAFYTDHRLPVQAGERLSVSRRTSRGALVKKDGVLGWYYGRLRDVAAQ